MKAGHGALRADQHPPPKRRVFQTFAKFVSIIGAFESESCHVSPGNKFGVIEALSKVGMNLDGIVQHVENHFTRLRIGLEIFNQKLVSKVSFFFTLYLACGRGPVLVFLMEKIRNDV